MAIAAQPFAEGPANQRFVVYHQYTPGCHAGQYMQDSAQVRLE
jgi:hypothetical protein